MSDLQFFWDPVCPFAWVTSRWVVEVQQQREYDVEWRFISLAIINEDLEADWYTPEYRAGHVAGLRLLRIADAIRLEHGNEAVGAFYTAAGTAIHTERRRKELTEDAETLVRKLLAQVGLSADLVGAASDQTHDAHIRAETELAFSRTGRGVGTPILTFHPGAADEGSFFGPVISSIPRGEQAARLWDAVEMIATTSGVSELKRSNRPPLVYD